jgi:hypothetical protein
MPTAIERLTRLQEEMNQANQFLDQLNLDRYLSFLELDGLLYIHYYGLTHREYLDEEEEELPYNQLPIFEVLSSPEVAGRTASLTFDGPDEGADGTRDWNFDWLLAQDVTFPELRELVIQPSPLGAHKLTVVSSTEGDYEENGSLARWLSRAPKLARLTTPSAPNAEFFGVEHAALYSMQVAAGNDAQDFILNLSRKASPFIWYLDWEEVHNFHMGMWEEGATPFEHFEALVTSRACPNYLTLRNPKLTDDQIRKLAALQRETDRGRSFWLRVLLTSYGLSVRNGDNGFWIEREASGKWRNSLGNEGGR